VELSQSGGLTRDPNGPGASSRVPGRIRVSVRTKEARRPLAEVKTADKSGAVAKDRESATAEPAALGVDDTQDQRSCNRRIEGRASRSEHFGPGLCGERMGSRHATGAGRMGRLSNDLPTSQGKAKAANQEDED
jgi:hypothetical protein